MTLAEDVSLEDYVMAKDDLSGADIKVCHLLYYSVVANLALEHLIFLLCHHGLVRASFFVDQILTL